MSPATAPRSVRNDLGVILVTAAGLRVGVAATLRYDQSDPFAVRIAFRTTVSAEVEWTFARQLLTDGVSRPTGDGDVRVWPAVDGHTVCLRLSSPSGSALFELGLTDLVGFLGRTYSLVPTGCEGDAVDLDAALETLLGSDLAP